MYTNMTEDLARGACEQFLNNTQNDLHEENCVGSSSILKALDICLQNNFFKFNGKTYQQKHGVGTGIKWGNLRI